MPPGPWKSLYISILIFHQGWMITNGQEMQDAISMTSDGWRPIIGTGREPTSYSGTKISQYNDPGHKVEFDIVKSENVPAPSSTASPQNFRESINSINNLNGPNIHSSASQAGKIPPHSKFPPPPAYHTLPPSPPHAHHRPKARPAASTVQGRPGQFGFRKPPSKQELPHPKRKPSRGAAVAHSNREEVFVHAPINIPYLKLGPSNVKTRETQGLSFVGKNHFTINQPNSHLEINRFPHPPTNDDVFEQFKSQSLFFPKLKNQQDEYTRNLVPPPPIRHLAEKEKLKAAKIPAHLKDNVATVSEPVVEFHDLGLHGFGPNKPQIQENLVQLATPFEQSLEAFHKQFKPKEPSIDVQVTKEKVKVWQNTLPKVPEYVNYDFHSLTNQGQLPNLQTYEVTEGKWSDNPNPYTFVYHHQQQQQQQQQPQQKPSSGSSARPQLVAEPIVELDVSPFLPTPYRPQGPFPTSSTHSEASTVFSLVTQKMNKYRNEALTNNPLFFDIKEVSTHYPIIGQPAFSQEPETDASLLINDNGETSNEITTQRPKTRRRRPQPRRPTTPTTSTTEAPPSTTTEEAESTESYDFQKVQQEPVDAETERPRRKQRPRIPVRGRYENSASGNAESEERPTRYRTTTPTNDVDDNEEKKTRSRHRYRTRGNKDSNEIRNVHSRKRTRTTTTTTTDMPFNHKTFEEDSSSMSEESYREPVRVFQIASPTRYRQDFGDESATTARQPVRIRYKLRDDFRVETSSPAEENRAGIVIEEVTEKTQMSEEVSEEAVTTTTEDVEVANINPPENEIDYQTASSSSSMDQEPDVQTTLATTIPTTTTTTTTVASIVEEHQTAGPGGKVRNRLPIKHRPRFSVKDYRQRLNQYTSTTPSTTTDFIRTTSERLRFPNRHRSRTTHASTTSPTFHEEEEQSTDQMLRRRFVPKEPRHGHPSTTTETANVISDKHVKAYNTRLRPFGQYRDGGGHSATAAGGENGGQRTSAGLYSRKRPSALRSKYFGKPERNATVEQAVAEEVTEVVSSTTEKENLPVEHYTEYLIDSITTETTPLTTEELDQDDYSQRVSELTSSFKSEYETPGMFKSVSPNSRRVPNYFTISTDDPILPIEAFFPNIKEREQ